MTMNSPFVPHTLFRKNPFSNRSSLRLAITNAYRLPEQEAVLRVLSKVETTSSEYAESQEKIYALAKKLVAGVRAYHSEASGISVLMHQFSLSSEEGIALMCLAEALLRIPDTHTIDQLISDKLSNKNWLTHLKQSSSLFTHATIWGLFITGEIVGTHTQSTLTSAIKRLINKGGAPLIRQGVELAMRLLGNQFVTGQTIEKALKNGAPNEALGYLYSYDMLGEAALTTQDAAHYYAAYEHAIHAIGQASNGRGIKNGPGISVKLSALHPRYAMNQYDRVMEELLPRLKQLLLLAKKYNIGFNIDAEESDRLELSLDLLEKLAFDPDLAHFDGIGFVVQAYQKRAPFVLDYLIDLASRSHHKFMVRLVKGAYWDSEIKRAQVDGLLDYPVYTQKSYTDISYLLCAKKLLGATEFIYSQFATHNAHSLATIYIWAQQANITDYEFQCLHGMGEALYNQVVSKDTLSQPCRIYAPVGSHKTLLAYLVRRLLENGANSSFVNQITNKSIPLDALIDDPFKMAEQLNGMPHPKIPLPPHLYPERKNSAGEDLSNEKTLCKINEQLEKFSYKQWRAVPLLANSPFSNQSTKTILNPANHQDTVGEVIEAQEQDLLLALTIAESYKEKWAATELAVRISFLMRAADLLEEHKLEFITLAIREAGKSLPNAVAEVREAVDFLRYYASEAQHSICSSPLGIMACISPWNFPLAIFMGQISACLVSGNIVLAKPAEQTPLIAHFAVQLLHQAGIPVEALQFLPGQGETIGAQLISDPRIKGVIFTGSLEVAQIINKTLTKRSIVELNEIPFIAETGGQNALIVDSSVLPEQVVQDIISSAFDSAGQRCSALRVLYIQEDIADKILSLLKEAIQELIIDDPMYLSTDIGPVIDREAQKNLLEHIDTMKNTSKYFYQSTLPKNCEKGTFVPPTIIEINALSDLKKEVFGPVLHVIRYAANKLTDVVHSINFSGYGLTLGIHSRIEKTINFISQNVHVGNIYINRNIVGAVVGTQPFGGEGKSGTGPKAGGPLYLKKLQTQASCSLNLLKKNSLTENGFLESLIFWAKENGYPEQAAIGTFYLKNSLTNHSLALPGPTGESNTLSFFPRGDILCLSDSNEFILNQAMATFATGNIPVFCTETSFSLIKRLPDHLQKAMKLIPLHKMEFSSIKTILTDIQNIHLARSIIEAHNDALIPIVAGHEKNVLPIWRLVVERTLCINTAATGGNIDLISSI